MKWAEARAVAAALADTITEPVQARVVILLDVPGTSYNDREAILRALARILESRGAVVIHLNGRRRLEKLINPTETVN